VTLCDPMKRERISPGTKEQKRAFPWNQLLSRAVDMGEAAQLFGLSPRQIKRLKASYGPRGRETSIHGAHDHLWQGTAMLLDS
jgi:hypothetical protein